MTYPGLATPSRRHDAAFQFHLVRIELAYVRQRQQTTEPQDTRSRTIHLAMQQEARAKLAAMRRLLHVLFD